MANRGRETRERKRRLAAIRSKQNQEHGPQAEKKAEPEESDRNLRTHILQLIADTILSSGLCAMLSPKHPAWAIGCGGLAVVIAIHIVWKMLPIHFAEKAYSRAGMVGAYIIAVLLSGFLILEVNRPDKIPLLTPGNDPMPDTFSDVLSKFPPDSLFIFVGANLVVAGKPSSLPVVRFFGTNLLTISITNSTASISGEFRSSDNRVVALIESNKFILGREALDAQTPDNHTLVVRDQENVEVLNLRYLNPRAFLLSGLIRLPNKSYIKFSTNGAVLSPQNLRHRGSVFVGHGIFDINEDGLMMGFK